MSIQISFRILIRKVATNNKKESTRIMYEPRICQEEQRAKLFLNAFKATNATDRPSPFWTKVWHVCSVIAVNISAVEICQPYWFFERRPAKGHAYPFRSRLRHLVSSSMCHITSWCCWSYLHSIYSPLWLFVCSVFSFFPNIFSAKHLLVQVK